jgi:NAD(P)-dependent dehydrogenase (short-subunit alcohol dehydrogenase family)
MTTDEKMAGKLDGRIALVTGGTSGIGLATAKRFVAEGAYVFITGRREKELAAAVKSIGGRVTGVQGDVSQIADLEQLFAQIKQEKGSSRYCVCERWHRKICTSRGDHRAVL